MKTSLKQRLAPLLAPFAVAFGLCAGAQAAEPWGIPHEEIATLEGTVVDIACHLTKRCVPECGGGTRQLGILQADGVLRMAAKGNVDFASPIADLLPYCNKPVVAEGLLVKHPQITLFFVQGVKAPGDAAFSPADKFLPAWRARTGLADKDEWWRQDPVANRLIAEDGPFGIKGLVAKPKEEPKEAPKDGAKPETKP